MNIGIMQGRLSEPTHNHIQEFPEDWEKELLILQELGFAGVEWLITKKCCLLENPILKETQKVALYPITSVCLDVLVDEKIICKDYLADHLESLCHVMMESSPFRNITIPLLEKSDMRNNKKREEFKILMGKIGKKYPDIEFSFEAELEVKKLEEIVSLCNNFYVTYDTGNVTSCGFNHKEYINFFADRINNVHLKDRTFDAKTVKPMTGDTDFRLIFNILKNVGYNKPFILQTAREELGKERETMLQHKKIFEELYENGV